MVSTSFKETEIGRIPVNWNISQLGSSADIFRGGSPRPIQEYLTTDTKIGVNWIKIGDVASNAKFINSTKEKIIPEGVRHSVFVHKGDLILSNSMSYGRPYILNIDGCIHDGWLVIENYNDTFTEEYLYYALGAPYVIQQFEAMAAGGGVKNLNKSKVKRVLIACPPKEEQRVIAAALSHIDAYIGSLEKLSAKKKAVKQGAMEELLSGKRRLPGFTANWQYINLAAESTIKARIGWQGLTTKEYLKRGYSYLVTGTDFADGHITWNTCPFVTKDRYDQDSNIQLHNGDILVTKDGTIGKVAIVNEIRKPATLNSGIFVIRPKKDSYYPTFIYYVLMSSIFTDFLTQLSAGSTIVHLYQKDIIKFSFSAPMDIEEQKAIANTLASMDHDISLVQKQLNKAKELKQGMAEALLTGKIRLM